tara:strand:+ start:411 stop:755 length:345 start_codon:yes stop_codon:yes gene_type:complete
MTINTQAKWEALRSLGHTGVQEDMELQFYLENGATISSVRDAEMQFLEARGFSIGAVQDRWKAFLTSLGYTGNVDDMLNVWWAYIAVALNYNLLLETGDDLLLEDGSFLLQEYA